MARPLSANQESITDWENRVRGAFEQSVQFNKELSVWVRDVYADHLIAEVAGNLYRVPFTEQADGSFLWGDWTQVIETYVEAEERYQDKPGGITGQAAHVLEETRDELREAQKARSKKYGIGVKARTNLTPPKGYPTDPDDYGDPVNYRYPIDPEHIRPAVSYFNHSGQQAAGGYTDAEWAIIGKRIAKRAGKGYSYDPKTKSITTPSTEEKESTEPVEMRSVMRLSEPKDGQVPEWIPLHVEGEWEHPTYGHFVMTTDMMRQAVENFHNCVLRPNAPIEAQVPLDERHEGGQACGWLTDMKVASLPTKQGSRNLLWGKVNWTSRGRELIMDNRYRYISPVYYDNWMGYGMVVKEATLTNRNFLKELPVVGQGPVLLSEDVYIEEFAVPTGGAMMAKQDKEPIVVSEPQQGTDAAPTDVVPQTQTPPAEGNTVTLSETEFEALKRQLAESQRRVQALEEFALEKEREARAQEVDRLVSAAAARGVDAYTIEFVKAVMLQLPRQVPESGQITLSLDPKAQPVKTSLYQALKIFIENVPAKVVLGEKSRSSQYPPNFGADEEPDKSLVEELLGAIGVAVQTDTESDDKK